MANPGIGCCINLLSLRKLFGFPVSYLLPLRDSEPENNGGQLFKARALNAKVAYITLQIYESTRIELFHTGQKLNIIMNCNTGFNHSRVG